MKVRVGWLHEHEQIVGDRVHERENMLHHMGVKVSETDLENYTHNREHEYEQSASVLQRILELSPSCSILFLM